MALVVERAVTVFLMVMMAALQVSYAAVHKVGDSAGWTIIGNIDYKKWAANKNFQIGDTISKSPPPPTQHVLLFMVNLFMFIVSRIKIFWKILSTVNKPPSRIKLVDGPDLYKSRVFF